TLVANPEAQVIENTAIRDAAELVGWHISEVLRVIGACQVPPAIQHAEAILAWCKEKNASVVDSTTLLNRGPNCVRDKSALDAAVAELVGTGWARPVRDVGIGDRKARRAWEMWSPEKSQESQNNRNRSDG